MAKALLITEGHDGLRWQEFGRNIITVSDFASLKKRQEGIAAQNLKRTWCKEHFVKIDDKELDGERIRFTWIWQMNQQLINLTYVN